MKYAAWAAIIAIIVFISAVAIYADLLMKRWAFQGACG